MDRRTFLGGALATAIGVAGSGTLLGACSSGSSDRSNGATARRYGSVELRRRAAASDAPNVLFVSIDDCNDWLGFLNPHPGTHTPNLDALAATSLSFTHAYTPAPMCLPARSTVLYGRAAHESGVYDHSPESLAAYHPFRDQTPSLVDDFWAAGYDTFGAGKVFHDEDSNERRFDAYQWFPWYLPGYLRREPDADPDRFDPTWRSPYDGEPIGDAEDFKARMVDFGPSGRAPEDEADGRATSWIVDRLGRRRDAPFFAALGHYLPHDPWRLPQRFFDLHPIEEVVVPEIREDDLADLGPYARQQIVQPAGLEFLRESGIWAEAVQAYQAAISFADHNVGIALDALASSPHADDTIVAVWSDHGFHLGEKMHLQKFTLWERASRVPLLLHVPGRFDHEEVFDPPVALADLGPTLLDLCGAEVHTPYSGRSLLEAVAQPELADERPPVSTWLAGNHAVRKGPWRYIRYRTGEAELYDHRDDPDEWDNLAGDPAHAATVAELDALLPGA